MKITNYCKRFAGVMLLFWMMPALAGDDVESAVADLQHGWAKVLYQIPQNQKEKSYRELAAKAHQMTTNFPGRVETIVWEAIVLSSYAEFQNGLGALGKLKTAKELLLSAEKINPLAMDGAIPMVLGVIHYKAPGWPISFGDNRKARAYLETALKINPEGIDPNFYYGEFLMQQRETTQAKIHLEKALAALPRLGREDADSGRKDEIRQRLQSIPKDN